MSSCNLTVLNVVIKIKKEQRKANDESSLENNIHDLNPNRKYY